MAGLHKQYANGLLNVGDLLHPREDLTNDTGSSPLAAVNATTGILSVEGAAMGVFTTSGTYALSLTVEATRDGVNWDQIPFRRFSDAAIWMLTFSTANTTATFAADIVGYALWRVRCSAYASGSVNVEMASCMGALPAGLFQKIEPATHVASIFGAANTAATLTIAAAGAGLFHYLERLSVKGVNGTAAAVAASAILQITTTNTPQANALNWRISNNFPAWAAQGIIDENYGPHGLRAAAANTATTIVVPALGIGVQAEITAHYRLDR